MRKLIIVIVSLLSLNLFGGLLHEDLDTSIKIKMGYTPIKSDITYPVNLMQIGTDITMKTSVYENDKVNLYLGGKINIEDLMGFYRKKINTNLFNISLSPVFGIEEKYNDNTFYQQLAIGIGYTNYYEKGKDYNGVTISMGELEFGLIMKNNILLSLGVYINADIYDNYRISASKMDIVTKYRLPVLTVGLGYEF